MPVVPGPPPGEERTFSLPVQGGEIRVTIRQPTERQRRILARRVRIDESDVELDGEKIRAWLLDALAAHFVRVDGYERLTSAGPVPISTADDLREYGEGGLLESIAVEIVVGGLTLEQKKTSDESSAGGSAETQASPGTAPQIENPASAPIEAVTAVETSRASSEGAAPL